MPLPKKADCTDCGEFRPVRWMLMAHGMEAVCAACLVTRKVVLAKAGRQIVLADPNR